MEIVGSGCELGMVAHYCNRVALLHEGLNSRNGDGSRCPVVFSPRRYSEIDCGCRLTRRHICGDILEDCLMTDRLQAVEGLVKRARHHGCGASESPHCSHVPRVHSGASSNSNHNGKSTSPVHPRPSVFRIVA
jgi:hypothetical protein